MLRIPQALLHSLRQVLMDCDEIYSTRQLYSIFSAAELKPWQAALPTSDNLSERVDNTISYLADKRRTSGESPLIILLRILGERYEPEDERHERLITLANQLEWMSQRPQKLETTALEANPAAAQMLSIVEAEKMLTCAKSVARIDVPRFRKGKQTGKNSTGTGWLIAPGLALTCWHVIEARNSWMESSIDPADLQAQLDNTLFTFDFTVAGKGLQYGIAALEYPTIETQILDYAILRLKERDDAPSHDRGYLRLDIDVPLTAQTSLYIIQHPLGQPQQVAGDTFERLSPTEGCILYKTPTEPGTSGSPVFNRVNWQVVALHKGENEPMALREGTLLKAILSDLEQHRLDLLTQVASY